MKKILLAGLSIIALGANAQLKTNPNLLELPSTPAINVNKGKVDAQKVLDNKYNQKKTRGGKLWYNIAESMAAGAGISATDLYSWNSSTNPSGHMNGTYLWPDSTVRFSPGGSGITFQSIGQVLDPTAGTFVNQLSAGDPLITMSNAFSVDSFQLFCSYTRKANKPTVVDTLILSFVTEDANNLGISGWTSGNVVTNFSADTVTFLTQEFDSLNAKPAVQKNSVGGGAPVIIKKYLDVAAGNDTISGGWNLYKFAPGINVPAGRAVSVSISFKPGETWANGDTIESFNNFVFVSHEENNGGFFNYTKRDYNISSVVTKTSNYIPNLQGWGGTYVPSLAYTAPYAFEFHNMDWLLNCTTCQPLNVNDIKNEVKVNVFPNPTSDLVNFDLSFNKSFTNTTIQITNMTGQVVKTVELGKVNANSTKGYVMNVSDLSKGLYIYTISADGKLQSGKLNIN